jgi:hypothetical protein
MPHGNNALSKSDRGSDQNEIAQNNWADVLAAKTFGTMSATLGEYADLKQG